ncbi:hypothetical protein S40285_10023 [Stachybotrys chlorohalonatus IBT 40285]|uniref:Uncharacterized protein n=1 Tax=Stachybotrys chlorohalonatus (strain IBT 40285) TaxID=1283841 RepID=A0A084QXN1_STAC4|nr:hypothetical protein S40285_10023 [Stachybotrys chlorohalonata IBT 40285]
MNALLAVNGQAAATWEGLEGIYHAREWTDPPHAPVLAEEPVVKSTCQKTPQPFLGVQSPRLPSAEVHIKTSSLADQRRKIP